VSSAGHRELEVWKQGMLLVEQCYRATRRFPDSELYGLTNQIRRAAVSIPSNIAEGHCRRTTRAYVNHVSIALGSHAELETQLELGLRLGLISTADSTELFAACASVGRLLNGLRRALETKLGSTPRPLASSP
jgi:four helix bundle protein